MKEGIHPNYTEATITCACGNVMKTNSTKADMKEADCPDKLCVHQKAISAENESIVCLPNRVVVTVTNSKKEGMDGFAQ